MKHLKYYIKTLWLRGLSTESVTEDKVWGVSFYQAHRAKNKAGRRLVSGETRISTSNFDTKDCAAMLGIIITGTNALVENCDRSQLFDYSQLNHYLCACFKLLKKQIDAGQSLISMEKIKSERVFMLMKMVK